MSGIGDDLRELLRALRSDLLDRRVLPIVAVLALAVVAIPVWASMRSKPATPVAAAPSAIAPPSTVVAAARPSKPKVHSPVPLGPAHDPFFKSPASTSGSTPPATATRVTATSGGTPTPTTSTKPTATTTPTTTKPTTTPTTTPISTPKSSKTSLRVYAVSLHFGLGSAPQSYADILRLDAFPSTATPVAQFLGVSGDGKTAEFLLWGARGATGDGTCTIGLTTCDLLKLKPGQAEFIDVVTPSAGSIQYELDLDAIKVTQAKTVAEARAKHAEQSALGKKLLVTAKSPALIGLKYSTNLGTLASPGGQAANSRLHLSSLISRSARTRTARTQAR